MQPVGIQLMLLILVAILITPQLNSLSTLTLTTNQLMIIYDGTVNQEFIRKSNSFDCSAYIYSFAQTTQQYQQNLPVTLTLNQVTTNTSLTISTLHHNFEPQLSQSVCTPPSCSTLIHHNCPPQLTSENYFDIVQLGVEGMPTVEYYLMCLQEFHPFYFQWGQLLISICATITIVTATLFARLEAFNGSGVQYDFKKVLIVGVSALGVGMVMLYAPQVAPPLLDVLSWIFGTISVGLVTLELLFRMLRHTCLSNSCKIGPVPIRVVDGISLVFGLGFLSLWWFLNKNWIVSNVVCVCIIISFIKVFKYTSLKVAIFSYLLMLSIYTIGAVLSASQLGSGYQVYFIFIANNPFQFQVPVITPTYQVNCTWVSFTSIALTGLLVAYLHRFDKSRATNIYLISSLMAYFFGSIIWNIVSSFSQFPIPFDAVCPPFILLTLSFMAFNRKELRTIWDGTFYDEEFFNKADIDMLGERLSIELPQMDLLRGSIPDEVYLDKQGLGVFKENMDYNLRAYLIPEETL